MVAVFRSPRLTDLSVLALKGVLFLFSSSSFGQSDYVLDDLPDHVVATVEARDRLLASLPQGDGPGLDFFVDDLQKWTPGQTIRVAFKGGTTALHKEIADCTKEITDACNIKFDFGVNPTTGEYRKWDTTNAVLAAEIRVSFDMRGNFSLVGRDSADPAIGGVGQPVGGAPNQRSLNLGGYDVARPASWKRTTRHEFLHALAFNHEHQSHMGGCDAQFRWENDLGYIVTQVDGEYVADAAGRRPGIYTYLSGAPNNWSRAKVDHNLRQASPSEGTAGTFDRESIMLYRFPPHFYVSNPNPCAPVGNSDSLSAGDKAGLKHLYPAEEAEIAAVVNRRKKALEAISKSEIISPKVKQYYAPQN